MSLATSCILLWPFAHFLFRLKYNPSLMSKYDYCAKFNMALSLNNINISLPNITSNDISITNYAMVQPMVAYFNTNYVKVPLQLDFGVPMVRHSPFLQTRGLILPRSRMISVEAGILETLNSSTLSPQPPTKTFSVSSTNRRNIEEQGSSS